MSSLTEAQFNRLERTALNNPSASARKEALLELRKLEHPRVDEVFRQVIAQDQNAEVRDLAQNLLRRHEIQDMIERGSFEAPPVTPDSSTLADEIEQMTYDDAPVPTVGEILSEPESNAGADRWTCRFCGTENTGGHYCDSCSAHRAATERAVSAPRKPRTKIGADDFEDVFLLQPGNRRFLTGERQTIVTPLNTPGSGCALLFLLPFVLVGLFSLGMAVYEWHKYNLLNTTGVVTQGEYIERYYEDDDDGGREYYARYTYEVDGMRLDSSHRIPYEVYNRVERGARVDVLYVPSAPDISRIDGTNGNEEAIFFTIFGVLWNAITWGILIGFVYSHKRDQQLAREGQLVRGELLRTRGTWHKSNYKLRVDYRFTPPDGDRPLQKSQTATRNDLKQKPRPEEGTPVAVLYKDRSHFKML